MLRGRLENASVMARCLCLAQRLAISASAMKTTPRSIQRQQNRTSKHQPPSTHTPLTSLLFPRRPPDRFTRQHQHSTQHRRHSKPCKQELLLSVCRKHSSERQVFDSVPPPGSALGGISERPKDISKNRLLHPLWVKLRCRARRRWQACESAPIDRPVLCRRRR